MKINATSFLIFSVFVLALAVASVNQFVHLRRAERISETVFAKNVTREVSLEIILVFISFVVAGYLTRLSMPLSG